MSQNKKSKFIDQAKIFIQAGNGGNGCVSFHRAKFVPKGGPDGGDGGKGGDVVLVGSIHMSTLQDFQYKRHFRAHHGKSGSGNQCKGKDGTDLEVRVPLGTLVFDSETQSPLTEVLENDQRIVIAEGGKGGLGNIHFKSSTHQAPREFTPGEIREGRWVKLEMRLIADVGIVGPPNAGKSTLLRALTAARPKVGNYPFTTLSPSLGVLKIREKTITLADVPGLIEGAHIGAGLGIEFLRHVARTRALAFVVPVDIGTPSDAWNAYQIIRNEVEHYDKDILERRSLVLLNKTDLAPEDDIKKYVSFFKRKKIKIYPISAEKKLGLDKLTHAIDLLV